MNTSFTYRNICSIPSSFSINRVFSFCTSHEAHLSLLCLKDDFFIWYFLYFFVTLSFLPSFLYCLQRLTIQVHTHKGRNREFTHLLQHTHIERQNRQIQVGRWMYSITQRRLHSQYQNTKWLSPSHQVIFVYQVCCSPLCLKILEQVFYNYPFPI